MTRLTTLGWEGSGKMGSGTAGSLSWNLRGLGALRSTRPDGLKIGGGVGSRGGSSGIVGGGVGSKGSVKGTYYPVSNE